MWRAWLAAHATAAHSAAGDKIITMPVLKSPLNVRRPIFQGGFTLESIKLYPFTLDAGNDYQVTMASPDDDQLVYIVADGNPYIAVRRDLDAATVAP